MADYNIILSCNSLDGWYVDMLIVYLEKRLARVVVELEGRTVLTRDVADVNPAVTAIIILIL